ncbi:hypothetical protein Murru_2306 [Allomuricauda ruestringensis DSM 13258]|uniref:Uncharacterized protein n=2 Tax=Flagellimonas TaxID=444459 RepID=G2PNG4_ALLRU|nr:hypothetical protein Murru_2306 [Allomuricauda ruestringensis DSM 13258]
MVLIDHHNFINIDAFEAQVIRDAKSLRKFYVEINKTRKPGLPVPVVDFSQELVILVCLGEQKGDKAPVLSKLKETDEEISMVLELVEVEKDGDMTVQAINFPFYLYKMPLVDKTITFQRIDH